MKTRLWNAYLLALFYLGISLGSARAETIELVTYYPTSSNTGDMHAKSLTVGDAYAALPPPNEGVALISNSLAIGVPVPANGTITPAGALEVRGLANQADKVLFMPGAGGTLNVGIGTANPQGVLHVVGVNNGISNVLFTPGTGAGSDIRVGIGTANPQQTLSIEGAPAGTLLAGLRNTVANTPGVSEEFRVGEGLADNDRYVALGYTNSGVAVNGYIMPNQGHLITTSGATNGLVIGTNANAPIKFVTNSSNANNEQMRIDANGNVGIGTTAPSDRLQVAGGNIVCGSTGAGQLNIVIGQTNIQARSGTNPADLSLNFLGGKVGIGPVGFSDPRYVLDVSGDIANEGNRTFLIGTDSPPGVPDKWHWIMAGGNKEGTNNALGFDVPRKQVQIGPGWTAVGFSSAAFKKDIAPLSPLEITAMLDKIRAMRVVRFRLRSEPESAPLHIGIIAEEAPSEVTGGTGQTIGFMEYLGLLVTGVKALDQENRRLHAELEEFKENLRQEKAGRTAR